MDKLLMLALVVVAVALGWTISDSSTRNTLLYERCKTAGGTVMIIGGEDGTKRCIKNIEYIDIDTTVK